MRLRLPGWRGGTYPYGTITVNSPGTMMLMTPAHMHISVEVSSRVGISASNTVGAPGTQGATVIGMHGIGVSTPIAAAVAAATIGFAGDMHMPKGMMFTKGMLSMILASGTSSVNTMFVGNTTSELGAIPMVHIMVAPIQTCIGIREKPLPRSLPGILAKPDADATVDGKNQESTTAWT